MPIPPIPPIPPIKDHTKLINIGINTHLQVDTHISSTANPHYTTLEQARTANNTVTGQIISTLATGTAPFSITSTTKVTNLNSDMLDGLHDTSFTKTTAGQTMNVTTSAELATALSNLAGAPSLLGNIIISMASGTYASNISIPSLTSNGYSLTLQGATTTTDLSTTCTGGTAGNISTQATVVKTLAGWVVNAYRGKWVKFTSGNLNNKIRLIESNTSDTLTIVGSFYNSAPVNGDSFIIYSNNVNITGDIDVSPTETPLNLTNINFTGFGGSQFKCTVTECKHSVDDYLTNTYELVPYKGYRNYYLGTLGITGLWFSDCTVRISQSYFRGGGNTGFGYHWSVLAQSGGQEIIYCGSVIDNYSWGVWADLVGGINLNIGVNDDPQADNATDIFIKNNVVGVYAQNGGHVAGGSLSTVYTLNGTNNTADATSYSWIGG